MKNKNTNQLKNVIFSFSIITLYDYVQETNKWKYTPTTFNEFFLICIKVGDINSQLVSLTALVYNQFAVQSGNSAQHPKKWRQHAAGEAGAPATCELPRGGRGVGGQRF